MKFLQASDFFCVQLPSRFAKKCMHDQAAAHANAAMNVPVRKMNILCFERLPPGQHVLVDAVNQRAIQIKQKCGLLARFRILFCNSAPLNSAMRIRVLVSTVFMRAAGVVEVRLPAGGVFPGAGNQHRSGSAMKDTLGVLLAGGAGERLYPLTRDRAKPAVTFGGIYRIIDITLSNCINSDLRRVYILTQYKALSLNRHIREG